MPLSAAIQQFELRRNKSDFVKISPRQEAAAKDAEVGRELKSDYRIHLRRTSIGQRIRKYQSKVLYSS